MLRLWAVVGVLALVAPSLSGQSSPAKPDLSGMWTLDTDVSTDLSKITFLPAANNGSRQSSGMQRGGFGGFGGGRRFGGERPREQSSAPKLTSDEQARLKALADVLKTGWAKLTITLHEPSFVVNDARDRSLFFTTDENAADNHIGEFSVPSTAHWDGDRLVTEFAVSQNMNVVFSYVLVANMKRLVVRAERKDGSNTRPFEPNVYLLYKRLL